MSATLHSFCSNFAPGPYPRIIAYVPPVSSRINQCLVPNSLIGFLLCDLNVHIASWVLKDSCYVHFGLKTLMCILACDTTWCLSWLMTWLKTIWLSYTLFMLPHEKYIDQMLYLASFLDWVVKILANRLVKKY